MKAPKKKLDSSRDLDRDGDVDLGDNRSLDLDRDGVIDGADREQADLDQDQDIDATDRTLGTQNSVGAALGMAKTGQSWQRSESQGQQQGASTSPKVK